MIVLNFPVKILQEREAEERWLAGGGQLYPGAGWSGDGVRPHASQHRGRHPQNRADHQEHPRATASCSGEQTRQVRIWEQKNPFFLLFPVFYIRKRTSVQSFPIFVCYFRSSPHILLHSTVLLWCFWCHRVPRPSPLWADHVSVKVYVGSGTA